MSTTKTKLATAIAWARRQRAIVFPAVLLLAVVVITALASLHGHEATSVPQVAAAAHSAPQPAAQPTAPQASARAPGTPSAVPIRIATLPASAGSAKQPAAPVALTPPDELRQGFVEVAAMQQDQFDHWTQVSSRAEAAQSTSHTVTTERHEKRIVWQAWVNLQTPATLAVLDVGGQANGRVTAEVDGASFGDALQHYRNGIARERIASIPLSAGWHHVTVTASLDPSGTPAELATRVSFGDGTNPPQPATPWAVPVHAEAPATAASADPQSTKPVPADAASNTVQGAAS